MHSGIRSLLAVAAGLALTCSLANAQLLLSGYTKGSFVDLAEPNTTVTNAGDGSWATFETGIPVTGSTTSRIHFANDTFTDVAAGGVIQVGLFEIRNGMTEIGSGAHNALFDLGLQITSPHWQEIALTQIAFSIDHTPNLPGAVPDTFSASFMQPSAVKVGDYLVQFQVNFDPLEFQVPENTVTQRGDISVTFTPVPEPSTYAAFGAALLVGLVAFRRFRGAKSPAGLPAAA